MKPLQEWSAASSALQQFSQIDWQRPWLAPLAQLGQPACERVLRGESVAGALNAARLDGENGMVRFVSQHALPPGVAYEQFIFDTASVPTRENLHDFFNGLIWLHFPETKRLLNRWQASTIVQQGIGAVRGPLRDAITVFDENGALLIAPEPLREALRQRRWLDLGVGLRALWSEARLVPFGHALLEKLAVQPRKSITAHVYLCADPGLASEAAYPTQADQWMANRFEASAFSEKPFNPLPVLGVPGWWSENENFCFYDDSVVFRSRKISQQESSTQAVSTASTESAAS